MSRKLKRRVKARSLERKRRRRFPKAKNLPIKSQKFLMRKKN